MYTYIEYIHFVYYIYYIYVLENLLLNKSILCIIEIHRSYNKFNYHSVNNKILGLLENKKSHNVKHNSNFTFIQFNHTKKIQSTLHSNYLKRFSR